MIVSKKLALSQREGVQSVQRQDMSTAEGSASNNTVASRIAENNSGNGSTPLASGGIAIAKDSASTNFNVAQMSVNSQKPQNHHLTSNSSNAKSVRQNKPPSSAAMSQRVPSKTGCSGDSDAKDVNSNANVDISDAESISGSTASTGNNLRVEDLEILKTIGTGTFARVRHTIFILDYDAINVM